MFVSRTGTEFGYSKLRLLHSRTLLIAEADETLFKNILHIKQQVLTVAGQNAQSTYNLRSRKHDCSLTVKHSVTVNEFLTRMLYKDMY